MNDATMTVDFDISGGAASDRRDASTIVRHFQQIVIWPLQIEASNGGVPREATDTILERFGNGTWQLVEDEFGSADDPLEERHYREFVSFLPHVQRFLYGDAAGPVRQLGYGDAPLRVYRRTDIAAVRVQVTSGSAPVTCRIAHIDLHLFYDIDVAILACEIEATDLSLTTVQELLYRFGRAYPPGWTPAGAPMHCLYRVEWLGADGATLATSDYENRRRYVERVGQSRAPCFATHWEYLLKPLVAHASPEPGPLRFRQIEYYRMPQMAYLTVDRLGDFDRGDFIRLAFANGTAATGRLPYSDRFLQDFERNHCYDRFFHEAGPATGVGINSRFLVTGHALTVIAEGDAAVLTDNDRGLLGQFRHQYYLLFMICHFHRAALLMLSDRLVAAIKRLEAQSATSAAEFRAEVYGLQESFMRFTQRYWFSDISDQAQTRDLFRMQRGQLDNETLYKELRDEIFDSVHYLDSVVLRAMAKSW